METPQIVLAFGIATVILLVLINMTGTNDHANVTVSDRKPVVEQSTGYDKYHTYVYHYTCIDGLEYIMSVNYSNVSPHLNQDGTVVPCDKALSTKPQ